NLPPHDEIGLTFVATDAVLAELQPFDRQITTLAKATKIQYLSTSPSNRGFVVIPLDDVTMLVPREDLIDLATETARVRKELDGAKGELNRANAKLTNPTFKDQAPKEVVDGVKSRKEILEGKIAVLASYLEELEAQ